MSLLAEPGLMVVSLFLWTVLMVAQGLVALPPARPLTVDLHVLKSRGFVVRAHNSVRR